MFTSDPNTPFEEQWAILRNDNQLEYTKWLSKVRSVLEFITKTPPTIELLPLALEIAEFDDLREEAMPIVEASLEKYFGSEVSIDELQSATALLEIVFINSDAAKHMTKLMRFFNVMRFTHGYAPALDALEEIAANADSAPVRIHAETLIAQKS